MFNPQAFPYVRAQTYTDGAAPAVLSDVFYNPVQDAIARLFGATSGISTSIATDDFCADANAASVAPAPFGTQFSASTLTNLSIAPAAATANAVCGAWEAVITAGAAPFEFFATEAACNLGSRQWIFAARVRIKARARIDTVANGGLIVGWGDNLSNNPRFLAGRDQANWHVFNGAAYVDTGFPVTDDTWTWLIASSTGSSVKYYITIGATVGNPVITAAWGGIASAARTIRFRETTNLALANDYLQVDMFGRGIER